MVKPVPFASVRAAPNLMFQRGQMAEGVAAAIMILLALSLVLVPYTIWNNWRQRQEAGRG